VSTSSSVSVHGDQESTSSSRDVVTRAGANRAGREAGDVDGNMFLPDTGTPINRIERSTHVRGLEPDPLTVAI
jgi:hypothetical protein